MEITNQPLWDDFIIANGSQFLQSWDWGELQKNLGRQIWRLGVLADGKLAAAALIIKHRLPLGKNYLYSPRGPIFLPLPEGESPPLPQRSGGLRGRWGWEPPRGPIAVGTEAKPTQQLFEEIIKLAKQKNSLFYRLEPTFNFRLSTFDFRLSTPTQPAKTLILDLTPSADELLNSCHQKTRYNIRLAEKKGVTVRQGKNDADFEIFWNLLQKTYSKQKIKTHPKSYYQQIINLQATSYKLQAKLYLAELKGQPVAANLCYSYGDTFTYAHGGSDYSHRELMAPHLLQWQQIKLAKSNGFKYYDFWGIDEKTWPGVTRFKLGFGGKEVSYPGTFDLPLNKPWYYFYQIGRKIL